MPALAAGGFPADVLTAVGTLALAFLTFATLAATIVIARRDSRRLRLERTQAQDQERLAEAAAVQVIGAATTVVINHGRFPITHVTAKLRRSDGGLVKFDDLIRVVGTPDDARLDVASALQFERTYRPDMLTPWDAGLRFRVAGGDPDSYPVVRWRDRWGQCWEHRPDSLRRIGDTTDWQA